MHPIGDAHDYTQNTKRVKQQGRMALGALHQEHPTPKKPEKKNQVTATDGIRSSNLLEVTTSNTTGYYMER